jgi:hypothetical protein
MSGRRRRLLIALACLVLVLVCAAWLLWPQRAAITRANGARIENGMTLAQVEAILGGPPRDESTGVLDPDLKMGGGDIVAREWRSDEVIIHVIFDRDGLVNSRTVQPVRLVDPREPLLVRLRRFVGL